MQRATAVRPAGHWDAGAAVDCVILDAEERQRRRRVLTGEAGTAFLLDLPQPVALRDGDGLVLEDGRLVRVTGRPEPLLEATAASVADRLRLAWHLGNRHTEMQIAGEALRIRHDHVLEAMLTGLGAQVRAIEAAFDPEPGAYKHGGHHHDTPHDHGDR
jgi:urease accessory protein